MKFESIENLIVWQKARTLAVESFAACKDAQEGTLKEWIQRQVIMIMNTIAEAYEKPSKKELIDSLYIAKIACGPCRSMFHLAVEMGQIDNTTHRKLIDASLDVTKLLAGFIKKLKEQKAQATATEA